MGSKLLSLFILASGTWAHAQSIESDAVISSAAIDTNADVQVVIDRNPSVQQMKVYKHGVLAYTFPVSTGREEFEFPGHGIDAYCTITPTVSVNLENSHRLRELYRSNTWKHEVKDVNGNVMKDEAGVPIMEGSAMGYAMAVYQGIFMHVAPPGTEAQIGQQASGGCIRMNACDAEQLFDDIAKRDESDNGKAFKRSECGKGAHEYDKLNPNGDQRADGTRTQNALCKPVTHSPAEVAADRKMRTMTDFFSNIPADELEPLATLPEYCTDEKQWPVNRKQQNVVVSIVDSRPANEVKCMQSKCDSKMKQYSSDKKLCLRNKLKGTMGAAVEAPTFNLRVALEGLEDKGKALTETCNKELEMAYEKVKLEARCDATGAATLTNYKPGDTYLTASPQKVAPIPLPRPGTRPPVVVNNAPNHPVPPLDIGLGNGTNNNNNNNNPPATVSNGQSSSESYQQFMERLRKNRPGI